MMQQNISAPVWAAFAISLCPQNCSPWLCPLIFPTSEEGEWERGHPSFDILFSDESSGRCVD